MTNYFHSADKPDLSAEVKKLENQVNMLQIENTELREQYQLSDKGSSELTKKLNDSTRELETLNERLNSV